MEEKINKKEVKSFEKSLEELETVAANLEKGNLNLEEAISAFEKGIKLSIECNDKLDKAEKKINILLETGSGELKESKFTEED